MTSIAQPQDPIRGQAVVVTGASSGLGEATARLLAGPVGEALVMTAFGLAVAIPAVLGYNFLVRSNRVVLSRLDAYAHDLFAFLTTGQQVAGGGNVVKLKTGA